MQIKDEPGKRLPGSFSLVNSLVKKCDFKRIFCDFRGIFCANDEGQNGQMRKQKCAKSEQKEGLEGVFDNLSSPLKMVPVVGLEPT